MIHVIAGLKTVRAACFGVLFSANYNSPAHQNKRWQATVIIIKREVCFSHLSLQKYNLVLNWGVFSRDCFTTESVTQGVSKVNTLPQPVSCLGPCDGILYHSQPACLPACQWAARIMFDWQPDRQAWKLAHWQTSSLLTNQWFNQNQTRRPVSQLLSLISYSRRRPRPYITVQSYKRRRTLEPRPTQSQSQSSCLTVHTALWIWICFDSWWWQQYACQSTFQTLLFRVLLTVL